MDPSQRTAGSPMPAGLSLLWILILFNMTFADTLSFMYPGFLKEVLTGCVGGVHITPGFLVAAAVLTEIPSSPHSVPRSCKRHAHLIAKVLPGAPTLSKRQHSFCKLPASDVRSPTRSLRAVSG